METIVDHLDTVNSNSFLKEIENPEKIKSLILKNFNNDTNFGAVTKPQFTFLKLCYDILNLKSFRQRPDDENEKSYKKRFYQAVFLPSQRMPHHR